MTDFNQFHDSIAPPPPIPPKIPDLLNVLTILSYIGCGMGVIGGIYSYFSSCKSVELMEKMSNSDNPMAGMMGSLTEATVKMCELRVPMLLVTLSATVLCLIGVILMRKLKRSGFFIYLAGELAPSVVTIAVLGTGLLNIFMMIGFVIPVIFIILYATQLKHMK